MITGPVRVLIADSDSAVRRSIRYLVSAEQGMRVVGEASSGEEALESMQRLEPDLVFLDAELPGMDGIEVVRRLSPNAHPRLFS